MASRIPESVIDEIAGRVSIVDVVGEHVRLKRKGSRYWGLCPFHGEKSPSFTVNEERNMYHCFGCGASGNAYGFLMRHDGLSFPEAVRRLADKLGIAIPESDEDSAVTEERRKKRDLYFEATELASRYFRAMLTSGRWGEPVRYLSERGIDEETAETFGLGFAPPEWSSLIEALGKRNVSTATLEMAGLVQQGSRGDAIDRFRNRVMFPIVALSKKTVAFSGRTLDPTERAKYVNSPETEFYTKGRELFGLVHAHRGIRAEGAAVLVEGNFDVVSLHARGLTNVCAPLGTAMTDRQAALLKRYTDRVVLLFDGDDAGRAAARKALSVLLAADVPEVMVVNLPDGSDPDDFVRREGGDALRRVIDAARPMLDECIDEVIRPAAGQADIAVKRSAADEVARLLQPLRNPMVRAAYISEAARRLELDERQLVQHVGTATAEPGRRAEPDEAREPIDAPRAAPVRALNELEGTLVEALASKPELLDVVYREEIHHVIPHPELAAFVERAAVDWAEQGSPSFEDAIHRLEESGLRSALTAALVTDRGLTAERIEDAFYETTLKLKLQWIARETKRLSEEARAARDFEHEVALMERLNQLHAWRRDLESGGGSEGAA